MENMCVHLVPKYSYVRTFLYLGIFLSRNCELFRSTVCCVLHHWNCACDWTWYSSTSVYYLHNLSTRSKFILLSEFMHLWICISKQNLFTENNSNIECTHPWPQAKKEISVVWRVGHLEETPLHSGQSIPVCEHIFYCSGKPILISYHISVNRGVPLFLCILPHSLHSIFYSSLTVSSSCCVWLSSALSNHTRNITSTSWSLWLFSVCLEPPSQFWTVRISM